MSECTHRDENGNSKIVFSKKICMIYPRVYEGYCKLCNKSLRLSEKEYKEHMILK